MMKEVFQMEDLLLFFVASKDMPLQASLRSP